MMSAEATGSFFEFDFEGAYLNRHASVPTDYSELILFMPFMFGETKQSLRGVWVSQILHP